MNILFVCTGNTCRSPMAATYFQSLCAQGGRHDVVVESAGTHAGTGAPPSTGAVQTMARLGLSLASHRSKPLDKKTLANADLVVVMTTSHRLAVGAVDHRALAKTRLLMAFADASRDVRDPIGGDDTTYNDCFQEMKGALDNLFLELDGIIAKVGKDPRHESS